MGKLIALILIAVCFGFAEENSEHPKDVIFLGLGAGEIPNSFDGGSAGGANLMVSLAHTMDNGYVSRFVFQNQEEFCIMCEYSPVNTAMSWVFLLGKTKWTKHAYISGTAGLGIMRHSGPDSRNGIEDSDNEGWNWETDYPTEHNTFLMLDFRGDLGVFYKHVGVNIEFNPVFVDSKFLSNIGLSLNLLI